MRCFSSLVLGALLLTAVTGCGGSGTEKRTTTQASAGADWMIVATGSWGQRHLGPYYYQRDIEAGKSYTVAVEAFGAPSSRGHAYESNVCVVRWQRLALEISFVGPPNAPCSAKSLRKTGWWESRVYSGRWQTSRGLRIGDSVERLRRLYPKARFLDEPPNQPCWILARERQDEFVWDLLVAEVWDGRVKAIVTPADYIY